jgi:hypothetical protein
MEITELKNHIKNLVDEIDEEVVLNDYYTILSQSHQLNFLPVNERKELIDMVDNPQNYKVVSHKSAMEKLNKWKGK